MTENKLEVMGVEFGIKYEEPKKIEISNAEELRKALNEYLNKYKGLVFTEDDLAEAKKIRAKLNKLKKVMNDNKRDVKKAFQEPVKELEGIVKSFAYDIDQVNLSIDVSIKQLEETQREERLKNVNELIKEMAPSYGVNPENVEIKSEWLAKTISHKKLVDAIAGELKIMELEIKAKAANVEALKNYCKVKNVDPDPYIKYLDFMELDKIMGKIDYDIEQKEKREQARKAQDELNRQALEQETTKVDNKFIDVNGEIKGVEVSTVNVSAKGTKENIDNFLTQLEMVADITNVKIKVSKIETTIEK